MKTITYFDHGFAGHAPGCLRHILDLLSTTYEMVKKQSNPQLVLCNCPRDPTKLYKNIRGKYPDSKIVFFTGENVRMNYDLCDLAICFDYNDNPKNFRFPLWNFYTDCGEQLIKNDKIADISHKDLFCGYVHRASVKYRNNFVKKLSQYKTVSCAGQVMNNFPKVGPTHEDKLQFVNRCKFFMCFENSQFNGYVTEKIVHGFMGRAIPLYWGCEKVGEEFNPKSFLNRNDYESDEEFIKKIIEFDNNDELYLTMLNETPFVDNKLPNYIQENHFIDRFQKLMG